MPFSLRIHRLRNYIDPVGKGRFGLVSPNPFGNESSGLWPCARDPRDEHRAPRRRSIVRPCDSRISGNAPVEHRPQERLMHDSILKSLRRRHCRCRPRRPVSRVRAAARRSLGAGAGAGARPAFGAETAPVRPAWTSRSQQPRPFTGAACWTRSWPRSARSSGAIKSAAHWMQQARKPAGHFAGIQFYQDDVDAEKWSWRLPTPADASIAVDMETLETVLAARACQHGRRDPARLWRHCYCRFGRRRDRAGGRRNFSWSLACRLRRRPQHGAQGLRIRLRRHRSRIHRLFHRGRARRSARS